jgi:hypothetical protein
MQIEKIENSLTTDKIFWQQLVFLTAISVIILRLPSLLFEPNLWAEEGSRYFPYAFYFAQTPEWYAGFYQIQRGYLALWPNLAATIAANFFPLAYAPLVMTIMAFVIQVSVIGFFLWTDFEEWQSATLKIVGVIVIIFVPVSGEVWLNTINSQFLLAVIAFLILHAKSSPNRFVEWLRYFLLLLAGLTGIVSSLLVPLFAYKAVVKRDKERVWQTAILAGCLIIQLGIFLFTSLNENSALTERLGTIRWSTLVTIFWTQSIGTVLLGLENIQSIFFHINTLWESNIHLFDIVSIFTLLLVLMFIGLIALNLRPETRVTLIGSYIILIIVSIFFSLTEDKFLLANPLASHRYFYAPNIILGLGLIAGIQNNLSVTGKLPNKLLAMQSILVILLTVSLFWGIMQYRKTTLFGPDWPNWKNEITAYCEDSTQPIEIWPPGWKMHLPPLDNEALNDKCR